MRMMMEDDEEKNQEFDLENPLPHLNNQISYLFDMEMESDHIPSHGYSHHLKMNSEGEGGGGGDKLVSVRQEAVSLITHFCFRFSQPYLSYLAITYLDRFLSAQGIPNPPERKPWVSRILAISCVSLALKMRTSDLISSVDIMQNVDGGIKFERKSIHRMELLILGVLKWRMRSVTPFCFMNFFVGMFKLSLIRDPAAALTEALKLKARANDIIVKAQSDVNLLEYKPSIIAASALLSACYTLFPLQYGCFKKAICNCTNVDESEVIRCEDIVEEIAMQEYELCIMDQKKKKRVLCSSSISTSTVNVLDRKRSRCISGEKTVMMMMMKKKRSDRELKRQRLSPPGG